MAVAVIVVLAALVVLLAALLLVERRRGRARLVEATTRADAADARCTELQGRLDDATAAAEAERAEAARSLDQARAGRDEAARRSTEAETRAREAAEQLRRLEAAAASERQRADGAEAERDRLRHDIEEAESRAARMQLRLDAAAIGSVELGALWDLELARSERTWRHSVAPLPTGPSPFGDAGDPLRLAVEIEAAALREEVGAPLAVRWEAAPVADPGHALLVLRLAQELLAGAAREGQTAVLSVSGDDDVVLHLCGDDADEPALHVSAPAVPDHLVTADAGDGVRLVVHRDGLVQPG